jgi:hypothetical protein
MISETNQKETEAAGLSFIFGMRIPQVPTWSPSGGASTQARRSRRAGINPVLACRGHTPADTIRSSVADTFTTGPGRPCAGPTNRSGSCKKGAGQRNQINRLTGGARSVNRKRELGARTKALAGLKGYIMDLRAFPTTRQSRRAS